MPAARTFTELFARIRVPDPERLAAEAGLIARNQRRGDMVLIGLFFTAILSVGVFIEEIRIDARDRKIATMNNLATPAVHGTTGRDSIKFVCTRCGWEHNLECPK